MYTNVFILFLLLSITPSLSHVRSRADTSSTGYTTQFPPSRSLGSRAVAVVHDYTYVRRVLFTNGNLNHTERNRDELNTQREIFYRDEVVKKSILSAASNATDF